VLTEVVRDGIPGRGLVLTLKDVHAEVAVRFRCLTLPDDQPRPEPTTLVVDTAEELVFARNAAADGGVDDTGGVIVAAPPPPPRSTEPEVTGWRARRVRTGGAEIVLRVVRGDKEHIVEYRAAGNRTAVVLLNGIPVHRGHYEVNHTFRLGRRGPRARLSVTAEPDIELSVDGTRLYSLRHATPGSDDHLEHRAHVIRNVLLAARDERREAKREAKKEQSSAFDDSPSVSVATDIHAGVARMVREPARVGMPPDQVIGVLSIGFPDPASVGFTDTALSIRGPGGWTIVPYDELLVTDVTADDSSLCIGTRRIDLPHVAGEVADLVNRVKDALVHAWSGEGEAPPVHPMSFVHETREQLLTWPRLRWSCVAITVLLIIAGEASALLVDGLGGGGFQLTLGIVLLVFGPLTSLVLLGFVSLLITAAGQLRGPPLEPITWVLVQLAVYAAVQSAWITWQPAPLGIPEQGHYEFGSTIRWGSLNLAFGNHDWINALPAEPRVLGTAVVTLAVFLPIATILLTGRRTRAIEGGWPAGKRRGRRVHTGTTPK
jgi:hypothetical protein